MWAEHAPLGSRASNAVEVPDALDALSTTRCAAAVGRGSVFDRLSKC
jgi:hypothetical protein